MIAFVVAIILVAFVFDFTNGFHDSANSIATIVGTRVLSPVTAVVWAAFFNFVALFTVGTAVAKAIGSGMIDVSIVNPNVGLGGLVGAIAILGATKLGIPVRTTHTITGSIVGVAGDDPGRWPDGCNLVLDPGGDRQIVGRPGRALHGLRRATSLQPRQGPRPTT